nr:MAG TPA: hypothetical protein [Caudoviricetes sp.]
MNRPYATGGNHQQSTLRWSAFLYRRLTIYSQGLPLSLKRV